jgi:hypothetical protein
MSETAHTKKQDTEGQTEEGKEVLSSNEKFGESKETPLEYSPKQIENVEKQSIKLEHNLQMFQSLIREVNGDEDVYISASMETREDGKKAARVVQEKIHALIHSYDHSKDHLSNHYDPRLVKAIGSAGKAIGGFAGFIGGHGVMSAPGSVAGAKAGGYLTLKAFEHLVGYLPDEIHEKIKNPKSKEKKSEVVSENEKKMLEKNEEKEELLEELSELCREIETLPEDQKQHMAEIINNNETEIAATANKMQETYSKYHDVFKRFEKKHPILATGTEIAVHAVLGPLLGSLEMGEAAVHAIEVVASSGGSEKLTSAVFSITHRIKDGVHSMVEKISRLKSSVPVTVAG